MRRLAAAVLVAVLAAGGTRAQPSEDPRRVIELPPEVADELRAEMRDHMDTLDELVGAVATGAFDQAAKIAETRMRMGHRLDERLRAAGYSEAEIEDFRRALKAQGWEPGRGLRGEGPASGVAGGMGPGRFVPDDFRAMGQTFHQAAQEFAATARQVGEPPTVADYENVLSAMQFVTSTCRSCHATYRLAR
ncbi:MAG: hypothetical protein ACLFU0_02195 [Alphaproteobacteria bacterium]